MPTTTVVPPCLVEGLALDVSILQALLKRHRCNHGRTLYYRRMAMALRCLERSHIVESIPLIDTLQSQANRYQQEKVRKRNLDRKRQRNQAEEQKWTLTPTTTTTTTSTTDSGVHRSVLSDLINDWQKVVHIWTAQTEEILSRIHHASRALFIEVSRGFFVPFCSVALAALARIRAMLMEIGQISLVRLYDLQGELLRSEHGSDNEKTMMAGVVNLTEVDYRHYMGLFMDEQQSTSGTLDATIGTRNPDTNEILASLGLSPPPTHPFGKKRSRQKDTGKTGDEMVDFSHLPSIIALEVDDPMGIDHFNKGSDIEEADVIVSSAGKPPLLANDSSTTEAATHATQLNESVDSQFREEIKRKLRRVKPFQGDGDDSKTSAKKRKTERGAVETGKTQKKTKSKSKKTSKGNFFDDLFG